MADSTRVALDVENPTQKKEVVRPTCLRIVLLNIERFRQDLKLWASKWSKVQEICNPRGKYVPVWKIIFVISCVFAVSLDPLFLYILIVDQENKCLQIDKVLRFAALLLRSITDVIFLVHLIIEIYTGVDTARSKKLKKVEASTSPSSKPQTTGGNSSWKSKLRDQSTQEAQKIGQKMSWLSGSMVIDFFAILPIPQIVTFYNMRSSGYWGYRNVLNFLLLGQYIPRICRIHVSANQLIYTTGSGIKCLFYLFLYILASHVLGAFWYFFSIQRETSCWYLACVNHSRDLVGCINTFYCDNRTATSRNITFLNEYCPLDTLDNNGSLPFNFGIFLDSLKNENTEHIRFVKKLLYSFWWGLRNLSNFGTNLTTSTYMWENLFAILISIVGLLLFLYLIGNVQTFLQMVTTKSEETRQRMNAKKLDVRNWISKNGIPHDMEKEIMHIVEKQLKRNKDVDVENLFTILPWKVRKSVKNHLCLKTLRRVPLLETMNIKVLEKMCKYLKHVIYSENSFVFRMGEPLDCMLIIIEGTIWTYSSSPPPPPPQSSSIPSTDDSNKNTNEAAGKAKELTTYPSMATRSLGKGDFYGEELLRWASPTFTQLPTSHQYVKTQTKVEAFALMARDLATVVSKCQLQWDLAMNCDNPQQVQEVLRFAFRRFVKNRRTSTRRQ